jgi:hypothetical protein
MKRPPRTKLTVRHETLRVLVSAELTDAVGGQVGASESKKLCPIVAVDNPQPGG